MARLKKPRKRKTGGSIGFPLIEEIKYRIKKHEGHHTVENVVDENDPLAAEMRATSYLDHDKHGAD